MVDLALLQSVSYIAGALGVCVAAIYYVMNLRISQRNQEVIMKTQQQTLDTRQAQLFTQIFSLFITSGFSATMGDAQFSWKWTDYSDFIQKYGFSSGNLEISKKYSELEMFLEGLGVLAKRGLVDVEFIEDFMGGDLINYWEKMLPVTKGMRERYFATWGEMQEYLYNEMKRIRLTQHPELYSKTSQ